MSVIVRRLASHPFPPVAHDSGSNPVTYRTKTPLFRICLLYLSNFISRSLWQIWITWKHLSMKKRYPQELTKRRIESKRAWKAIETKEKNRIPWKSRLQWSLYPPRSKIPARLKCPDFEKYDGKFWSKKSHCRADIEWKLWRICRDGITLHLKFSNPVLKKRMW